MRLRVRPAMTARGQRAIWRLRSNKRSGGSYAAIIWKGLPPSRYEPEKQPSEALRPWQPLFERSELVGCHSKASEGCPVRNAAESFFFATFFFAEKKKVESRLIPYKTVDSI